MRFKSLIIGLPVTKLNLNLVDARNLITSGILCPPFYTLKNSGWPCFEETNNNLKSILVFRDQGPRNTERTCWLTNLRIRELEVWSVFFKFSNTRCPFELAIWLGCVILKLTLRTTSLFMSPFLTTHNTVLSNDSFRLQLRAMTMMGWVGGALTFWIGWSIHFWETAHLPLP